MIGIAGLPAGNIIAATRKAQVRDRLRGMRSCNAGHHSADNAEAARRRRTHQTTDMAGDEAARGAVIAGDHATRSHNRCGWIWVAAAANTMTSRPSDHAAGPATMVACSASFTLGDQHTEQKISSMLHG